MQNILDFILKNNSLTKEQKSALIQNYYAVINEKLDTDLQKELLKKYLGASLEIASSAIPIGKVGKIGASLSKNLLQKNLGRRLSEQLRAHTKIRVMSKIGIG